LQKIIVIFLISVYISGCSVSRNKSIYKSNSNGIELDNVGLREASRMNLMSTSFFIQKAEIELIKEDKKQNLIASVKFNKPDSFLVSVRLNSGIEAVRVFLTKDTILINDRINKMFYYGSKNSIKDKLGIGNEYFILFFGEIVSVRKSDQVVTKCENGISAIDSFLDKNKFNYVIDCNKSRLISASVYMQNELNPIVFKYKNYEKFSNSSFPGSVTITGLNNFNIINIKFLKIQTQWEGHISFNPGSNYEQIEIK